MHVNLGERYRHGRTAAVRRFLSGLVRELFSRPLVEVTGSQYVDVIVNRMADHDELAVHLVNTAGPHHERDVYTFDEIPPVGPLEITIRTGEKPKAVRREPSGEEISFTFADGQLPLDAAEAGYSYHPRGGVRTGYANQGHASEASIPGVRHVVQNNRVFGIGRADELIFYELCQECNGDREFRESLKPICRKILS